MIEVCVAIRVLLFFCHFDDFILCLLQFCYLDDMDVFERVRDAKSQLHQPHFGNVANEAPHLIKPGHYTHLLSVKT